MEGENQLERNMLDNPFFVIFGALIEGIIPGIGTTGFLIASTGATYFSKPVSDRLKDCRTPQDEMLLYAIKNSARTLIGATAVSALRYFL